MEIKLKAWTRQEKGRANARNMRARGEVPGVMYGLGSDASSLAVQSKDLWDVVNSEAGQNALIDLQLVDGKNKENHLVMIKELQRHPLKELLLHVDFLKVARDEKISLGVPISIIGEEESVGLKAGGAMQHVLWEVELECLPQDVPDHIVADITELAIGDNLRVSDLALPRDVELITDPEDVVLTILAPRLEEELEEVEEEEVLLEEVEGEEGIPAAEEEPEEEAEPPEEG